MSQVAFNRPNKKRVSKSCVFCFLRLVYIVMRPTSREKKMNIFVVNPQVCGKPSPVTRKTCQLLCLHLHLRNFY